jgi:hypothetical protein
MRRALLGRTWTGSWVAVFLLLAGGCGTDGSSTGPIEPFEGDPSAISGGDQIGDESAIGCLPEQETVLARDDISVLGFSGQQVLDHVSGEHVTTLTWSDQAPQELPATQLTVAVSYNNGRVAYLDNEWRSDNSGTRSSGTRDQMAPQIGTDCPDTIEIDVQVTFSTEDGAFAETFDVTLIARSVDSVRWSQPLEALEGSFDAAVFVPTDEQYDTLRAWVDASFVSGVLSGVIQGQTSYAGDAVAMATQLPIASF